MGHTVWNLIDSLPRTKLIFLSETGKISCTLAQNRQNSHVNKSDVCEILVISRLDFLVLPQIQENRENFAWRAGGFMLLYLPHIWNIASMQGIFCRHCVTVLMEWRTTMWESLRSERGFSVQFYGPAISVGQYLLGLRGVFDAWLAAERSQGLACL